MKSLFPLLAFMLGLTSVLGVLHAESPASSPDSYGAPDTGRVSIVRDSFGVPHIIARDNRSLFLGVGYAQAEDQLENLAMNYLRSQGRAAEPGC